MEALGALEQWPVDNAAAGVLTWEEGDRAAPALIATVGDLGRAFAWASVTKLATSLAAHIAAEELTLPLDAPAGPPGATVAHLLSHASGLAPGTRTVLAPPGQRRIYSNAGYEWAADLVAERAEMDFSEYLADAVLGPLAMDSARLGPADSPAAGLVGTLGDLLALAAELITPALVSSTTADQARRVAFPGLAGTLPGFGRQQPCDWGLGPEIRGDKRPHWTGASNSRSTFGHFGQAGGFLWVDPVAHVALAVLTDRDFGPWAAAAWPPLADAVLAELREARPL